MASGRLVMSLSQNDAVYSKYS